MFGAPSGALAGRYGSQSGMESRTSSLISPLKDFAVMFLISLLDGARLAGLEVDAETQEVEGILGLLERGETLPPPH